MIVARILMFSVIYWWVFLAIFVVSLITRLTILWVPTFPDLIASFALKTAKQLISNLPLLINLYGHLWWIFLILVIIAAFLRWISGCCNVQ
jgi:hypothetical protein